MQPLKPLRKDDYKPLCIQLADRESRDLGLPPGGRTLTVRRLKLVIGRITYLADTIGLQYKIEDNTNHISPIE